MEVWTNQFADIIKIGVMLIKRTFKSLKKSNESQRKY